MRLNTKDLGFSDSEQVYVNEHLTRECKQLLGATIGRKKEVNWRYVWTAGGKVLPRKDESAVAIQIRGIQDLDKVTR